MYSVKLEMFKFCRYLYVLLKNVWYQQDQFSKGVKVQLASHTPSF